MIIISEQEFNKIFSKQLKAQLKLHEMTQSDLAKHLGVSTQSVTNWCKGAKTPRMDKVDAMCSLFNCKRSDLMEEKETTIDIIKKRRLELELTLKDVAKALGVSEATVSRYESGEIQNMGIDKIESLSSVLRCSPGYLMGWSSETTAAISNMDKTILDKYHQLNDKGKQRLLERADELIELGYVAKRDELKEA